MTLLAQASIAVSNVETGKHFQRQVGNGSLRTLLDGNEQAPRRVPNLRIHGIFQKQFVES